MKRGIMFDLHGKYPYFEEVNDAIMECFHRLLREDVKNKIVLDVGCGQGQLSFEIKKLGYDVWGVESSSFAAKKASERITRVLERDLTDLIQVEKDLGDVRFDYIVFSDVLEHVPDPLTVLKGYRKFLKKDGRVLISLPNVANWVIRLKLILGRFDYEDSGVMDRTHLRFFTFKTSQILVREAGLKVCQVSHTPFIIRAFLPLIKKLFSLEKTAEETSTPAAISDSNAYRMYLKYFYPLEKGVSSLRKTLFSFRIIINAGPLEKNGA